MVCTADELLEWKDFPKGLRVLLLDEDSNSAAEIRSKLEEMDYIVTTFCSENEALSAISNKTETFHVAIVEAKTGDGHGSFKFLESANDLPTIMTSNMHCLSTMMKCIALGAVEFLQKPLSENKLRNIWQHVVHKAFNTGASTGSDSLKPLKESLASQLQLQMGIEKLPNETETETETLSGCSDKLPAPSTPQSKGGERLMHDGDCQTEKESAEQAGESKSVETTCGNSIPISNVQVGPTDETGESVIKEEDESVDGLKSETNMLPHPVRDDRMEKYGGNVENQPKARASKKKMKVDWTSDLHKKFLQAVEQLGIDQAIPSRILELMKVNGLTRHNVASHLQKYRMHRRHILPKEDDRRWQHTRDTMQRGYYQHRPIMAYPPYHSHHSMPAGQLYPVWGQPNSHLASPPMWGHPSYPAWHLGADAWGCPVLPPPHAPYPSFPQNPSGCHNVNGINNSYGMPQNPFDSYPAEEVIDHVVKEAISKPWMPLPLGLKPPSTDSVLAELSRQGISSIPPHNHF